MGIINGKELLWKAKVQGTPGPVASSILEGEIIMVASSGDKDRINIFNGKGNLTGSALFPGTVSSLSCSNMGNICAAYGNSKTGQQISVYTPDGKEAGGYHVKEKAEMDSRVFVVDKGSAIVAGVKDKGVWSIYALDNKGTPIWYAPIKEGLKDFIISWDGKRIAVITEDARLLFFQQNE